MGRRSTDKRQRLVEAAAGRFHRDGIRASSIAEIARDAEIPVGNVYYYFRTKDDLARAVVDHWNAEVARTLGSLLPAAPPRERLDAYLESAAERAAAYAALGCPLVALARDLRRSGDGLAPLAKAVHAGQIDWLGRMFRAMGHEGESAGQRARILLATLHGSYQLAHALGDAKVIIDSIASLKLQLRATT